MNWQLYFVIGALISITIMALYILSKSDGHRPIKISTIVLIFLIFIPFWPITLFALVGTALIYGLVRVVFWSAFDHEW